jgi:hypothetical protein
VAAKSSWLAALAAAATLSGSIVLSSGDAAAMSILSPSGNLSGNPYFPLVVGATWKYKDVGGPSAASILVTHVVSDHKAASGEAVTVRDTIGSGSFTAQYVIGGNGSIAIEASAGSGSNKMSISGMSRSFIPSASQVFSCHPCHFTAAFTTKVGGFSTTEHLTEAATSLGMQTVVVPAGRFRAEKIHMLTTITASFSKVTMTDTASTNVYLAKNVGTVESGSGTASTTVAGHKTTVPTGTEELLQYTP